MKFHRKSYLSVCSFGGIGIAGVLPERQEEDTCFDEQGCLPGDGLLLNRWKNSALQSAFSQAPHSPGSSGATRCSYR